MTAYYEMTPQEFAAKLDHEGGVWDAYMYGLFDRRTGDESIDQLIARLRDDLSAAESTWGQLQELLPEPWGDE